jgi:hypothetical protein
VLAWQAARWGTRTLDVDSPLVRVEAESLEGPLLAERLGLVNELVAAVVASAGVALGVLVCGGERGRGVGVSAGDILCMTLPSASRTACEVKFSEGIRLMKCFWRFFSCGVRLVSGLLDYSFSG